MSDCATRVEFVRSEVWGPVVFSHQTSESVAFAAVRAGRSAVACMNLVHEVDFALASGKDRPVIDCTCLYVFIIYQVYS